MRKKLKKLSAYIQWKWHNPEDALARSEGAGSAPGTLEAVGAAAATGCARCPPLAHTCPRLPPRPLVPPLTAAMLTGAFSSASAAATVPPFAVECTDHSLSALAARARGSPSCTLSQLRPQGLWKSLHEEIVEGEVFFHTHWAVLKHCVKELAWFPTPHRLHLGKHIKLLLV